MPVSQPQLSTMARIKLSRPGRTLRVRGKRKRRRCPPLQRTSLFDDVGGARYRTLLVDPLLLYHFNPIAFLEFLSNVTGIENLPPDPSFEGGGLHQIARGGKLGLHADWNKHGNYALTGASICCST